MPYAPLLLPEREEIARALTADKTVSWTEIGRRVGRHRSTIEREVTGHGGRDGYRPAVADRAATAATTRPRACVLAMPGALRDRVTAQLRQGRSPVAIAADLTAEGAVERVCPETIYMAVYGGVLDVKAAECLRMRRPRRRGRQTRTANKRAGLPNIGKRPAEVADRSEAGHWEGDHLIGKGNGSALLCLTERVSRYSLLITMPEGYDSTQALAGLIEGLEQIPPHLRLSITFDQGSEWAQWQTLVDTYTGFDVWFCDPHSPWQRGQVENLNRQWRYWFPRGTDLAVIDPEHANHAAAIINNQRRRSLDFQTPATIYAALNAH